MSAFDAPVAGHTAVNFSGRSADRFNRSQTPSALATRRYAVRQAEKEALICFQSPVPHSPCGTSAIQRPVFPPRPGTSARTCALASSQRTLCNPLVCPRPSTAAPGRFLPSVQLPSVASSTTSVTVSTPGRAAVVGPLRRQKPAQPTEHPRTNRQPASLINRPCPAESFRRTKGASSCFGLSSSNPPLTARPYSGRWRPCRLGAASSPRLLQEACDNSAANSAGEDYGRPKPQNVSPNHNGLGHTPPFSMSASAMDSAMYLLAVLAGAAAATEDRQSNKPSKKTPVARQRKADKFVRRFLRSAMSPTPPPHAQGKGEPREHARWHDTPGASQSQPTEPYVHPEVANIINLLPASRQYRHYQPPPPEIADNVNHFRKAVRKGVRTLLEQIEHLDFPPVYKPTLLLDLQEYGRREETITEVTGDLWNWMTATNSADFQPQALDEAVFQRTGDSENLNATRPNKHKCHTPLRLLRLNTNVQLCARSASAKQIWCRNSSNKAKRQ
eukprot:GHVT01073455.1.p1 GENE.GHVT01073455.1~~GHVT01073455.1.p1  ORF type:complete len:501 (+),score=50.52 GHVT01073455.1:1376-2878(+)